MGKESFIIVADKVGSDDAMELPLEKDGTVLLSTVQAQFPSAIGLKYKRSSGAWRGVRVENNVLDAPEDGWGETTFIITESKALKRKSMDVSNGNGVASKIQKTNYLDDIIVLGLPYSTTAEEFEKYFTDNCGELAFHELKYERETKKSRGFGFIRFKTEEAAKKAINKVHEIEGRKLEVRMSKQPEENPKKLFIGRLPEGTTEDDVKTYFSGLGELVDCFVPVPFRGFGFVTYASQEDAMNVLRATHELKGVTLNVTVAERKGTVKTPGGPMNIGPTSNKWNPYNNNMGNNLWRPENPMRLFVGRLPGQTTNEEVTQYFSQFGVLSDTFVPNPFKGFGFVTFSYQEDAMRALNITHNFQGARLNVTAAEPKEAKENQQENGGNYTWDPKKRPIQSSQLPSRNAFVGAPPAQKDVASELKDLLMTLISKS